MVPAGMLMGTSPIVIALTGVAMGGEKLVVSSAMGVGGSGKVELSPEIVIKVEGAPWVANVAAIFPATVR